MLNNQTILITGGTGSFGKNFLKFILKNYKGIKKIIIFSRDELKQQELMNVYKADISKIRFFIGDVRDRNRLMSALRGVDIVIHAAALKQVPASEYNPFEFIKTNILGAQNIIECCIENNVRKVIALSTDKAAAPINLYGATKLCSDKLFSSSNNIVGSKNISFSVIRYGNVMGSRGSIIPLFLNNIKNQKPFKVTNKEMTRFNITIEQAISMVIWVIKNMKGGEIFVPKISSYRVTDLVKAISPKFSITYSGIRPGEKIHEEMITVSDSYNTYDLGKYYAILNPSNSKSMDFYHKKFKKYLEGKSFNSKDNKYLTINEIKNLLKSLCLD
jgi:UDP-N-acetylglucosamine 4,6-dehydratase (inverting)